MISEKTRKQGLKRGKKRVLDPLVCMDVRNISRDQLMFDGSEVDITTSVYGKTYVSHAKIRTLHDQYVEMAFVANSVENSQRINLVKTACNYGGYRWWFLCPLCNKRVCKLYLISKYGCRDCNNLTYRSQIKNRRSSLYQVARLLDIEERLEKLTNGLRTTTYRSRPTKRYEKITKLVQSLNL